MSRSPSVLRASLELLSARLVLQQIGLALLVLLLYAVWLRMPDASVVDVIGSALLALVVLAVAGMGESLLMLSLAGVARSRGKLLRGAVMLFVGAALWAGWCALLDHMHGGDDLRAGYLNSRFPHQLRNVFSFEHLVLWLGWMWTSLARFGAGVIGLFVFALTASTRPLGAASRTLRCLTYWVAVVLSVTAATVITGSLIEWTPGHGIRVEMLSLALRLSLAALIDTVAVCLLLTILATCVRQADAAFHLAPAGTPDESQPRTAGSP
jgi:hypothetical protein